MALTKIVPLPFKAGLKANYIRVDQVAYNRRERVLEIVLGYYMDKESCDGERPPVGSDVIRLQGDEAEIALHALHDAAGPLVYDFVKEKDSYADATDA